MIKLKIGDYFDVYQEGKETKRMIAISNSPDSRFKGNWCDAMTINPVCYDVINVDKEVEKVLGNIFND